MIARCIVLTNGAALCYRVAVKTIAALALFCTVPSLLSQSSAANDYKTHITHQVAKVQSETAPSNAKASFHANWNSLASYRTPDWFRDAKFGIFIHWGVYSVPAFGNEWYSRNMYIPTNDAYKHQVATYGPLDKFGYKDFIPLFKAEHFDPDAWVTLFQQAGARYIVPVAEHCDGFAMYASVMTPAKSPTPTTLNSGFRPTSPSSTDGLPAPPSSSTTTTPISSISIGGSASQPSNPTSSSSLPTITIDPLSRSDGRF